VAVAVMILSIVTVMLMMIKLKGNVSKFGSYSSKFSDHDVSN